MYTQGRFDLGAEMPPLAFGGAAAPRTKAENKNGQITHFQMGSVCRFPRVVLALGSGGGERDFIEHINLNLVTANSCLIKGVHITHINFYIFFFPGVPRRVSQRTRSLGNAGLRGAGLAVGFCRGRCLFFSHCWLPPLDYFTAADLSLLLIS